MKFLVGIIRAFIGIIFIISGLVKVVDPKGFSYKLEEYFAPDVLNLPFLIDYALPLSTFFVILEVILGVLLLLGLWRKFTIYSLLFLVVFFSFLTFYSAYFNKVTDCGCFGDALKLTPWGSFTKDIVLLIAISFLVWKLGYIRRWISKKYAYVFLGLSILFCSYLSYKGIYHLPMKDFRPYAIGKNIQEGMKSAKELGLPQTKFETVYVLKNTLNNKLIKVPEEQYMADKKYWGDGSVYEFVDTEDKIIQKGYEPPIHDFVLFCNDEDQTQEILSTPHVLYIITPFPLKVTDEEKMKIKTWLKTEVPTDYKVVHLSTTKQTMFGFNSCTADGTTLKTIIRANPGIMVTDNATVVGKYSIRDLPSQEQLKSLIH